MNYLIPIISAIFLGFLCALFVLGKYNKSEAMVLGSKVYFLQVAAYNNIESSKDDFKNIDNKITIKENDMQLRDASLDIIDKLCELYSDEISLVYPRIIPLILGLLSDTDISIVTKRKIISCLSNIGDSLSNYLYLIIPELINCLTSLMNKIKLFSINQNISETKKLFPSLLHLKSSSLFGSGSNQNNSSNINISNHNSNYNENNTNKNILTDNNNLRNTLQPRTYNYENSIEKKLEQDILNLMDKLINIPGIIKYMEKIIHILCLYMEGNQYCQKNNSKRETPGWHCICS